MHRTLIIGVGSIGERHLRCFKATGRAEVGFVEVNASLRETIAKRYEVKDAFADLDAALAKSYDTAVVCTPAQLHIPIATRLAEAGVHVLIEKPLSTSFDGIDRLKTIIAQKKLTAGVAYVWRASPVLGAMRNAIRDGRFGKPKQVVVVCGQHFPTFRPAYRDIYYKDRKTGGGAIQDALTHMINAVEWIVGPVDRLAADAAHQVLEGVTVEDTVNLIARHGPVLASYTLNQFQAPNETFIMIACDGGTARFEPFASRWCWMMKSGDPWEEQKFDPWERDGIFIAQANLFLDAVESKSPVACTIAEAEQTLRVNLAALASVDRGLSPI